MFRIILIPWSKGHYLLEQNEIIGLASVVIVCFFQDKKFIIFYNLEEYNHSSICWKAQENYHIFTLSTSK